MKKIISVILSTILLVTSVSAAGTSQQTAEPDTFWDDPDMVALRAAIRENLDLR